MQDGPHPKAGWPCFWFRMLPIPSSGAPSLIQDRPHVWSRMGPARGPGWAPSLIQEEPHRWSRLSALPKPSSERNDPPRVLWAFSTFLWSCLSLLKYNLCSRRNADLCKLMKINMWISVAFQTACSMTEAQIVYAELPCNITLRP